MFQVKVAEALRTIIEAVHKPKVMHKGFDEGYVIGVKVSILHDYRYVFFLIAGNRCVWMTDSAWPYKWQNLDPKDWTNTADHDSCWFGDGIERPLSTMYFAMCEQANRKAKPIDLQQFCCFYGCPIMEKVMFHWEHDGTYKKKLTLLEKWV